MTKLGQKIASFGAGASFGELALLNNQKRAASIMALTNCEMVTISKEYYLRAMRCYHVSLAKHSGHNDIVVGALKKVPAQRSPEDAAFLQPGTDSWF